MDTDYSPESTASPEGPNPEPPARQGRIYNARSLVFVVLCGVLGYLAFALFPLLAGPNRSPAPETGVAVQAPPPAPSTPTPPAAVPVPAGPPAAPPQRLVYPAAGIDVVVHPLEPTGADRASQTIVPPPTMDGYWLTPYGVPGAGSVNTTYVAGHSWQDQEAPFNRLSTHAAPGDRLTVTTSAGDVAYRVDSVTTYVKSGLKDSPIWQVVPNRLVLISCYTDDFWGTNVVVVASPEAASQ
ncbi:class F sortase [Arthrobacter sp. HS15c]|uniref:class F sortase n=1 Tax=Arthrobacter sp. HS15c TaxID=3230279 RepID=UPI0034662A1A